MSAPRLVHLDFSMPVRKSPVTGAVLCVLGVAATIAVGIAFQTELAERARLDAQLSAISQPHRSVRPADPKTAEDIASMEQELRVPWTALLSELEAASHDVSSRIAVLQVEPDASKHTVRITAEARNLQDALAYLTRLQQSHVLRYPMLESHERRKDDPEHPVRLKLSAEWRA